MEEISNRQDEEKLLQKVRSKRRIRGLLICINVLLGSYFVFELVRSILDFASSNTIDTEIIPLNGHSKENSLELYDKHIAKDENGNYIVSEVYDYGIYGGYLSLSKGAISNGNYSSFENISLINVSSDYIDYESINHHIKSNYLNGGIDLTSLEKGDYLVFDAIINEVNYEYPQKAIKIRSEVGVEKTIYTLPNENNVRKKITIKSKDSSPSLVISVNEVNSLPEDYYDYIIIGTDEQIEAFKSNNVSNDELKINYVNNLLDGFKSKSDYCVYLSNEEKMIVSNYVNIKDENVITLDDSSIDEENKKVYTSFIKELGGNLLFTGSCNNDEPNSFITKPYLEGYDIGKFVVISNLTRTLDDIKKIF